MSRGKQLVIAGIVALLALAAVVVAAVALQGEPIGRKFNRLEYGMAYDEVIAILGEPTNEDQAFRQKNWGFDDGVIWLTLDALNRVDGKGFLQVEPLGFLDRVLSWFGL